MENLNLQPGHTGAVPVSQATLAMMGRAGPSQKTAVAALERVGGMAGISIRLPGAQLQHPLPMATPLPCWDIAASQTGAPARPRPYYLHYGRKRDLSWVCSLQNCEFMEA